MVEHNPNVTAERDAAGEEASEGADLEGLREQVGFSLHAIRRRPKLAALTFLVVAGVGLTIAATMPLIYNSQVRLLAQRSAIYALTGQNTQIDDNPTKNVAAMIIRRDNLVALAKEANLPKRFDDSRPAALRFKDRIMAKLFGALSDEDKLNIMVLTLEKKLEVTVTEDSNVTISVDWSDPRLAYDLVTLVQKNFLEARYDSDVAVINDSIAVLEEHTKSELAHVDTALNEYQKILATRAIRPAPSANAARAPAMIWIPRSKSSSEEAAPAPSMDLMKDLEEKRLQIRAVEEARQRTIETLNQQLTQAQLTLTPMHPTVIALQQQVATMSEPSPELRQLQGEERALMAQIAPPRAPDPVPAAAGHAVMVGVGGPLSLSTAVDASAPPPEILGSLPPTLADRDGPLQLAQSELELAIRAYEESLVRLDATKVQLDITGAAYKHRYTVVTPATLPKGPKKATAQLVGFGSVLGALILGILFTTGLDMMGGKVLESWQVRRKLKLDVLGELDNPSAR